jgi:hypothetical protein
MLRLICDDDDELAKPEAFTTWPTARRVAHVDTQIVMLNISLHHFCAFAEVVV